VGHPPQLSKKLLSFRDRLGCFSFRGALSIKAISPTMPCIPGDGLAGNLHLDLPLDDEEHGLPLLARPEQRLASLEAAERHTEGFEEGEVERSTGGYGVLRIGWGA